MSLDVEQQSSNFFTSVSDEVLAQAANTYFTKPLESRKRVKPVKSKQQSTPRESPPPDSKGFSGDRFIPVRGPDSESKTQLFHMKNARSSLSGKLSQSEESPDTSASSQESFNKCLKSSLLNSQECEEKVLTFKEKAPMPQQSHLPRLHVLYSVAGADTNSFHSEARSRRVRHISKTAEKILDAPDLVDDFYLNLLDWSNNDTLAIGLGSSVYLWDASSGNIEQLYESTPENQITSVRWTHSATHLAIGTEDSLVAVWDVAHKKQLRKLRGHSARVGSLAWNKHVLSTGSQDNLVMNHDVRIRDHHISTFVAHEQEICGLTWDPQGTYLASGANDNMVCIWENNHHDHERSPLHILMEHNSAVKALAWCPWQTGLLATGGGTADRQIRFFHATSGQLVNSVDAQSQVCSLVWNPYEREILSSHGFSKFQLSIWQYPSLVKTHDLTGHTSRVLHTTLSADGTMVCSAAADETLRFWRVFEQPKQSQSLSRSSKKSGSAVRMIR